MARRVNHLARNGPIFVSTRPVSGGPGAALSDMEPGFVTFSCPNHCAAVFGGNGFPRRLGPKQPERENRGRLPAGRGIEGRPAVVDSRTPFGDWEGDTILAADRRGGVVTLVGRKSAYPLVDGVSAPRASTVRRAAVEPSQSLPATPRVTVHALESVAGNVAGAAGSAARRPVLRFGSAQGGTPRSAAMGVAEAPTTSPRPSALRPLGRAAQLAARRLVAHVRSRSGSNT